MFYSEVWGFIFKTVAHDNKNGFKMEYLVFGYLVDCVTVCMIRSVVQVSESSQFSWLVHVVRLYPKFALSGR